MTLPSSTTSTAGSVTLDPTSPGRVSTVRTSSTAAFSCLPPQRTIAYTEELSLCLCGPIALFRGCGPRTRGGARQPCTGHPDDPALESVLCAGSSGYQTPAADASGAACPADPPAASGGPGSRVAARRRRRPPNGWAGPDSASSPSAAPLPAAAGWLAAAPPPVLASAPGAVVSSAGPELAAA